MVYWQYRKTNAVTYATGSQRGLAVLQSKCSRGPLARFITSQHLPTTQAKSTGHATLRKNSELGVLGGK